MGHKAQVDPPGALRCGRRRAGRTLACEHQQQQYIDTNKWRLGFLLAKGACVDPSGSAGLGEHVVCSVRLPLRKYQKKGLFELGHVVICWYRYHQTMGGLHGPGVHGTASNLRDFPVLWRCELCERSTQSSNSNVSRIPCIAYPFDFFNELWTVDLERSRSLCTAGVVVIGYIEWVSQQANVRSLQSLESL